jgi:hypothetical protein
MNEKSQVNRGATIFSKEKKRKSPKNHERGTGQLKSKAIKKGD